MQLPSNTRQGAALLVPPMFPMHLPLLPAKVSHLEMKKNQAKMRRGNNWKGSSQIQSSLC